ncbi:hypothetical protein [Nannocystis pusilla]|uniref:hypothetical protein n=1 Tax=Nannocystis pusilla TaxID=889268 RepID=UPI003DA355C5
MAIARSNVVQLVLGDGGDPAQRGQPLAALGRLPRLPLQGGRGLGPAPHLLVDAAERAQAVGAARVLGHRELVDLGGARQVALELLVDEAEAHEDRGPLGAVRLVLGPLGEVRDERRDVAGGPQDVGQRLPDPPLLGQVRAHEPEVDLEAAIRGGLVVAERVRLDVVVAAVLQAAQGAVVAHGALTGGQRGGAPAHAGDLLAHDRLLAGVVEQRGEASQDLDVVGVGLAAVARERLAGEGVGEGVEQALGGRLVGAATQPGTHVGEQRRGHGLAAEDDDRELQRGGGGDRIFGEAGEAAVQLRQRRGGAAAVVADGADQAAQRGGVGRVVGVRELEVAPALARVVGDVGEVEAPGGAQARQIDLAHVGRQQPLGLAVALEQDRGVDREGDRDRVIGHDHERGLVAGVGAADVAGGVLDALAVLDPRGDAHGGRLAVVAGLVEQLGQLGREVGPDRLHGRGDLTHRGAAGREHVVALDEAEALALDSTCLSGQGGAQVGALLARGLGGQNVGQQPPVDRGQGQRAGGEREVERPEGVGQVEQRRRRAAAGDALGRGGAQVERATALVEREGLARAGHAGSSSTSLSSSSSSTL